MGKKLLTVAVAAALLGGGIYLGSQLGGDNSATIVGGADRYAKTDNKTPSVGLLTSAVGATGTGQVHQVRDGQSIQEAVRRAAPGDVIQVFPGTYKETVYIDKDDILLTGVIEQGKWPTMEGERKLNDAVLYSGNNITVENLLITHYKGNAIMGQAGNNFLIRNNRIVVCAMEPRSAIGEWDAAEGRYILRVGSRLAYANCHLHVGERRILRASAVFAVVPEIKPKEESEG